MVPELEASKVDNMALVKIFHKKNLKSYFGLIRQDFKFQRVIQKKNFFTLGVSPIWTCKFLKIFRLMTKNFKILFCSKTLKSKVVASILRKMDSC